MKHYSDCWLEVQTGSKHFQTAWVPADAPQLPHPAPRQQSRPSSYTLRLSSTCVYLEGALGAVSTQRGPTLVVARTPTLRCAWFDAHLRELAAQLEPF